MQKHVNLVDLVKSFPTNIYLQNLASIQKRTGPVKFAHLAEKSEKGSISNLSTKVQLDRRGGAPDRGGGQVRGERRAHREPVLQQAGPAGAAGALPGDRQSRAAGGAVQHSGPDGHHDGRVDDRRAARGVSF